MIMFTTFIINFHTLTCMLLPYPALPALYDTNDPRLVNPSATRLFPNIVPLNLPYLFLGSLSIYFSTPPPSHSRNFLHQFSSNPSFLNFSPSFYVILPSSNLLMTSFLMLRFFLYLLYPKALFTRVVGGIISACISIYGRQSTVPLPVSNVSTCISSH